MLFRQGEQGNWFELGHDEGDATGVSLSQFLPLLPEGTIKIWFDIKNLDNHNAAAALLVLQELDRQYVLQERLLVETSMVSAAMTSYGSAGFHTVYYSPVKKILELQASELDTA